MTYYDLDRPGPYEWYVIQKQKIADLVGVPAVSVRLTRTLPDDPVPRERVLNVYPEAGPRLLELDPLLPDAGPRPPGPNAFRDAGPRLLELDPRPTFRLREAVYDTEAIVGRFAS